MTRIAANPWIESVESLAGVALLFVCPVFFFLGAWLVDRRVRRHGSVAKRWFALAVFSVVVLALFFALIHVPQSWQFSSDSSTLVSISYAIGLGWLATPFLAVPCTIIGVFAGIISFVIASRRSGIHEV